MWGSVNTLELSNLSAPLQVPGLAGAEIGDGDRKQEAVKEIDPYDLSPLTIQELTSAWRAISRFFHSLQPPNSVIFPGMNGGES